MITASSPLSSSAGISSAAATTSLSTLPSSRLSPRSPPPGSKPLSLRPPRAPRCTASFSSAAERERRETSSAIHPMATVTASLYDVLGIPAAASFQEIKAAYRRLARACHPDVVATDRKSTSADQFIRINNAYSTLSDPDKRAAYDRKILVSRGRHARHRPSPFSSSPFSSSGFSWRTWETDQCW